MKLTRGAASVHKWLALLVGLPILGWFVSGLFIAFVPEDAIHGHAAHAEPARIQAAQVAGPLAAVLRAQPGAYERIEVRTMLGRPVVQLTPTEAPPRVVDLSTGRTLTPVDQRTAVALAREAVGPALGAPIRAEKVVEKLRAYQGPLPAWRVDFTDANATQVYVAADLGRVIATRNRLFRVFDVMWSIHILNFEDPRGINTPWLWAGAALATVLAITGFIILPSRLRRRRRGRFVGDGAGEAGS